MKALFPHILTGGLVAFHLINTVALAQGNLTPPGAPGPTMKTLQQIEPRAPISALPFTISQPGSYYLITNLTGVAGTNGITIAASGVTLDLMGFELVGVAGSLDGVRASGSLSNISVRNGTVRGWGNDGVDTSTAGADNGQFHDLRLSGNAFYGLGCGPGSTVVNCVASVNGVAGIRASFGSTVSSCAAYSNLGDGIATSTGCTINKCTAEQNTMVGINAGLGNTVSGCTTYFNPGGGIHAGANSMVSGCTVYTSNGVGIKADDGSTVSGCTAANNTNGIVAGSGSTVTGCTANGNRGDGINIGSKCRATGNHCSDNGTAGTGGAGIHAVGSENTLEGNSVIANQRGIWADQVDGRNLVVRNMARNNVLNAVGNRNYDIATGNRVAQTVIMPLNGVALAGETGGNVSGTTDPWSNISY